MEERAIEEKQIGEARDRVRAQLHRATKLARQIQTEVPPHMLGR
jgi:hypothetical protein